MASLLKGTAFITGAASGIGRATAVSFAQHGIKRLALADINGQALKASNAELRQQFSGVEILDLTMDVQDSAQVSSGIAEAVRAFGRLDVAVNNAGTGGAGEKTHELPESEWNRIVGINLNGVWRCQREELGIMLKQEDLGVREGRGRIINVASMYGIVATGINMSHPAYCASKHGVLGLTKADANAYGPLGIRINAICPGYVETPLVKRLMDTSPGSPLALDIARTPLQRTSLMEEVGDAISFLASPLSSFMQGAALVADGGFTTQ